MNISNEFAEHGIQKILEVKDWGLKSFRITKQVVNEKLGKGTRTVDFVLEEKIEKIKDTKSRYQRLLGKLLKWGASSRWSFLPNSASGIRTPLYKSDTMTHYDFRTCTNTSNTAYSSSRDKTGNG